MANISISATATTGTLYASADGAARTGIVVQATTSIGILSATARASYAPIIRALSTVGTFTISGTPTVDVAAAIPLPVTFTGSGKCLLRLEGQKMSLDRVVAQIYNLFGIEITTGLDIEFARERVLEIINSALQIMYSRAEKLDFFNRSTLTLTYATGETSKTLPVSIQMLLGPVKTDDGDLEMASTISQFEQYLDIYFSGETITSPRVAFLDRRASSASFDSQECILRIAPAPADDTDVTLDFAQEAPYFGVQEYLTNARLRIPHSYVESVFLPLCKYFATMDPLFKKEALRKAINDDYQRAMIQLGEVNPDTVPTRSTKP